MNRLTAAVTCVCWRPTLPSWDQLNCKAYLWNLAQSKWISLPLPWLASARLLGWRFPLFLGYLIHLDSRAVAWRNNQTISFKCVSFGKVRLNIWFHFNETTLSLHALQLEFPVSAHYYDCCRGWSLSRDMIVPSKILEKAENEQYRSI